MKKVLCIFCNQKRERAKEHVWPRWLQQKQEVASSERFRGTNISLTSLTVLSSREQSGESLVFGEICKVCNNGWMNELETQFRPCLESIKTDFNSLKSLKKVDRTIISLWGLKTAMMINLSSNYRNLIPQNHFRQLYSHKQLPKNVKVYISYLKKYSKLKWEQTSIFGAIVSSEKAKTLDLKESSYVITMQIGHLGLKLIYYQDCKEKGFVLEETNTNRSFRISPYVKNSGFRTTNGYEDISEFHNDVYLMEK